MEERLMKLQGEVDEANVNIQRWHSELLWSDMYFLFMLSELIVFLSESIQVKGRGGWHEPKDSFARKWNRIFFQSGNGIFTMPQLLMHLLNMLEDMVYRSPAFLSFSNLKAWNGIHSKTVFKFFDVRKCQQNWSLSSIPFDTPHVLISQIEQLEHVMSRNV